MRGKIYDREEMNRVLPLVRLIVKDLREGYRRLRRRLSELGIDGAGSIDPRSVLQELPWEVRDLVDELRTLIDELGEVGVFLRDPERGLIEAYGELGGEIVYFSWRPGESEIGYYHGLFGSHRDRRPVLTAV